MARPSLVDDKDLPDENFGDGSFQLNLSDISGISGVSDLSKDFSGIPAIPKGAPSPMRDGPFQRFDQNDKPNTIPDRLKGNNITKPNFGLPFEDIPIQSTAAQRINSDDDIFENIPIGGQNNFNDPFSLNSNQQNNNIPKGFEAVPMDDFPGISQNTNNQHNINNLNGFDAIPMKPEASEDGLIKPIVNTNQTQTIPSSSISNTPKNPQNSTTTQGFGIAGNATSTSSSKRLLGGGFLPSIRSKELLTSGSSRPETPKEPVEDDLFADIPFPDLPSGPETEKTKSNPQPEPKKPQTQIPQQTTTASTTTNAPQTIQISQQTPQEHVQTPENIPQNPQPVQISTQQPQTQQIQNIPQQTIPINIPQNAPQQTQQIPIQNQNVYSPQTQQNYFQQVQPIQAASPQQSPQQIPQQQQFPMPTSFAQYSLQQTPQVTPSISIPPPQTYSPYGSYSPVYSPIQTQLPIELGFSASLDRSMSNFKRMFTSEFSSIIRQQSTNTPAFEVDDFADKLSNEIANIIEAPIPPMDINSQQITRRIASSIDEQTKPVTSVLAEAEARNTASAEHHISELKQLQEELEALRTAFKSNSDNIIRELERERQNSAAIRDAELSHSRDIEQKLRSLKLREVELDTRSKNQAVEKDSIERSMKQFEQKKREWEDETLPKMYDEGSAIRRRILEEINSLRNDISQESFDDLSAIINDGLKVIKDEGENLRNELIDLEMANRWVMSHVRESVPKKSPSSKRLRKSTVLDQTQEKLSRIRRQRQESMKDFSDQLA